MPDYLPTQFNEGTAPGISAAELNKLGSQYSTVKTELQRIDGTGSIQAHGSNLVAGTVTDAKIGNRTVDQAIVTPYASTGTLTQVFSWIVKVLKALLGTTNWHDAPPTTLTAAKSHIDATAPHSGHATTTALSTHTSAAAPHTGHETPTGAQTKVNTHAAVTSAHSATSAATANRIMMRDASGRAKVAAPSAADDIARKDTVDVKFDDVNGHDHDGTDGHGPKIPLSSLAADPMNWVQPGETVLLSSPEEVNVVSGTELAKRFQIVRPGRYRISGEHYRSTGGVGKMFIGIPGIFSDYITAATYEREGTSTWVPFTMDMTLSVAPGGILELLVYTSKVRNVLVKYADGTAPTPSVLYTNP